VEASCLLLKNVGDRIHRFTRFELLGERMINQFFPCLPFVILQGSVEELLEVGMIWVTHITNGRQSVREEELICGGRTTGRA
jgi:hypothetical protein